MWWPKTFTSVAIRGEERQNERSMIAGQTINVLAVTSPATTPTNGFPGGKTGVYSPVIYSCVDGSTSFVSATVAFEPACSSTQTMWCQISYDGTTLKVKELANSGSTPSSSDWSSAT
jgi:hypothetical protein